MKKICVFESYAFFGDVLLSGGLISALKHDREVSLHWLVSDKTKSLARYLAPDVDIVTMTFPWNEQGAVYNPIKLLKYMRVCLGLRGKLKGSIAISVRGGWFQRFSLYLMGIYDIIEPPRQAGGLRARFSGGYVESVYSTYGKIAFEISKNGVCNATSYDKVYLGEDAPVRNLIALAPEASQSIREWDVRNWKQLIGILKAGGYECVMILNKMNPDVYADDCPVFKGDFGALSRLLNEARGVVAVDSFVGHFAVAHGLPTVTLYRNKMLEKAWGFTGSDRNETIVTQDEAIGINAITVDEAAARVIACMNRHRVGRESLVHKTL